MAGLVPLRYGSGLPALAHAACGVHRADLAGGRGDAGVYRYGEYVVALGEGGPDQGVLVVPPGAVLRFLNTTLGEVAVTHDAEFESWANLAAASGSVTAADFRRCVAPFCGGMLAAGESYTVVMPVAEGAYGYSDETDPSLGGVIYVKEGAGAAGGVPADDPAVKGMGRLGGAAWLPPNLQVNACQVGQALLGVGSQRVRGVGVGGDGRKLRQRGWHVARPRRWLAPGLPALPSGPAQGCQASLHAFEQAPCLGKVMLGQLGPAQHVEDGGQAVVVRDAGAREGSQRLFAIRACRGGVAFGQLHAAQLGQRIEQHIHLPALPADLQRLVQVFACLRSATQLALEAA